MLLGGVLMYRKQDHESSKDSKKGKGEDPFYSGEELEQVEEALRDQRQFRATLIAAQAASLVAGPVGAIVVGYVGTRHYDDVEKYTIKKAKQIEQKGIKAVKKVHSMLPTFVRKLID